MFWLKKRKSTLFLKKMIKISNISLDKEFLKWYNGVYNG